jgi:enoyl-CoA hydratase
MLIHRMCKAVRDLPLPVLARVNRFRPGAALEVMPACDLHIAAGNAVFGMPEVRIGLPSVLEAALRIVIPGWQHIRADEDTPPDLGAETPGAGAFIQIPQILAKR